MRGLGFIIQDITQDGDNFTIDLRGYSEELEYSLLMKIKRGLGNDCFVFHENSIELIANKDSNNIMEALKRKLKIKNNALNDFPKSCKVWSIFPIQGEMDRIDKIPATIKAFLTGKGNDEFFIYIDSKEKTLILDISADNDEHEFMRQLHACNNK